MSIGSALTRREFLYRTSIMAGGCVLCGPPAGGAVSSGVPARRLERLATGANVGRWFRYVPQYTEEHFTNYIPEAEAAMMVRLGLRHVRLVIHPHVLMDQSTGAVLEDRAVYLEAAIRTMEQGETRRAVPAGH